MSQAAVGRLAFVGVGQMNGAILAGLIDAGWDAHQIAIVQRSQQRRDELVASYRVEAMGLPEAAEWADTVVIGVKPYAVADVLAELAGSLRPQTVVISIAAGITTAALESHLVVGQPVVRVMPNTPSMVGVGMAAITGGVHASAADVARAEAILGAVGRTIVVGEKLQDAVSAISGSGPAYFMLVCEALTESAVTLGVPRAQARELVAQTLLGSGELLTRSGELPVMLRENVTSPGGTTAAAVAELEAHGLRAAFLAATRASVRRSGELT